ncbi:MAG: acyl-CoA dehydrogenase family protein [Deltaproteobacteria bacterium]|nr:acyl-CoA dehydrogenase family protein [Deltaproteobacteria bacterium]
MIDKKTTSYVQSLCMGEIQEEILLPYPRLSSAEQETLKPVLDAVSSLLKPHEKDFRSWDVAGELPTEFLEELRQIGLFGLVIPEEHGGSGLGSTAYSRTLQEIARHDASVAVTVGAHSSIGMRGLLLFGTDEQKLRYMPKLATGEMIAAFCLTEPGSGSDAASVKTTAVKEGDHWVLNGEKLWITNGGIADFFTVFARTASGEKGQLTAFLVTRDMPGVSSGPHEDKLGIRASNTTTVSFENVRVPDSNVLGEVGKGFKTAMRILNSGRTGLGGGSVGAMKSLIGLATRQARERVQFGRPIAEFGLIKGKVGQMVIDCYAAESVVNMVAGLVDGGYEDYAVEAAISKVLASENLWRTADEALQIAGGNGYMRELKYERVLRDARINRIFEGTNDILRLFIALTGMNLVSSELKELAGSLKGIFNDPIKGFGVFSEYALRRAKLTANVRREKAKLEQLHPALREEAQIVEDGTRELALAAERTLRRYGKRIIGQQFSTRRLADVLIDLYALSCVMARVHSEIVDHGAEKAARQIEIARALGRQVRRRVRDNFAQLDDNEDDLLKALADDAFEAEKYRWDNVEG